MRTNVMTNPSFESAVWAVLTNGQAGSSSAISTTQALYGTHSAKLVNTGTAADDCYMAITLTGLPTGTSFRVSGWMYIESNTGNSNSNRAILCYATGVTNVVSTNISSYATGTWVRYSVTATTGAGTTLTIRIYAPPGTVYWDGILVEQGTVTNDYFDGDTADTVALDHAWTGSAHNSTSTETPLSFSAPRMFSMF